MSKVKYEDKEEGEVSPNLQVVPKVLKEVAHESKPTLASYSPPSTSLPTLLPYLTSSCCDIPVVCYGGNIIQPNRVLSQDVSADDQGDGQDGQAHSSDDQPHDQGGQLHSGDDQPHGQGGDDQQHTVSRVLLSAISPWLASLIEGVYYFFAFNQL